MRLSRKAIAWAARPKTGGPSCANCTAGGPSPTPNLAEEVDMIVVANLLFDGVLCELEVVGGGQPVGIVSDCSMEPTNIRS